MEQELFDQLLESVTQMDEIQKGKREAGRCHAVPGVQVKEVRINTGLAQESFARLINVSVSTLRNWEQGRREPRGPARALIHALGKDPQHVIIALNKD